MHNKHIPQTREEKIEFLKQLARGQASPLDIIPKARLHFFEKEPDVFAIHFVDPKGAMNVKLIGSTIREKDIVQFVDFTKKIVQKKWPDAIFECGIMPYEKVARLDKIKQTEY